MTDMMDGQRPRNFPFRPNHYRLYFMDRPDGHIGHLREFEAPSDETAIMLSEDARAHCAMELWRENRKIKRWEQS